jgi:hypothetical protein
MPRVKYLARVVFSARYFAILVAIVTTIAAAQPSVSALTGILPATWIHVLSSAVTICGSLLLLLAKSPLAQLFQQQEVPTANSR